MIVKKYMVDHIGEEYPTKQGFNCKIIDGGSKPSYCTVKLSGELAKTCIIETLYSTVKSGGVKNPNFIYKYGLEHMGEIHYNSYGYKMEIIKGGTKAGYSIIKMYGGVEEYISEEQYTSIKRGAIKNRMRPRTYGVGYLGIGIYGTGDRRGSSRLHDTWKDMLRRCYGDDQSIKNPSYKGVIVCKEWHNFQNFAKWYNENYRVFEGVRTELDKDFLGDGTIYSPNTCIFLPQQLNGFMTTHQSTNTSGYIGVTYHKRDKIYETNITIFPKKKRLYLGRFNNPEDAYEVYKKARAEQCEIVKKKCIEIWGITDERILNKII